MLEVMLMSALNIRLTSCLAILPNLVHLYFQSWLFVRRQGGSADVHLPEGTKDESMTESEGCRVHISKPFSHIYVQIRRYMR